MEDLMLNEEVVEGTEEFARVSKIGKSLKVCAGVVVVSGVSFVTYKYAVKPLVAKVKDRREAKKAKKQELEHAVEVENMEEPQE